jgi:anti-sigma factor RsiW
MECVEARTCIECYADGQLEPVLSSRIEEHVQHCPACRHALERLTALRVVVKEAAPYHPAPRELAGRIRKLAGVPRRDAPTAATTWWLRLRPAALVAVTAAVTWIAAFTYYEPRQASPLADELIAGHARATLTGHLSDIASSQQHAVKPWLSSKLDFSPSVPDLSSAGFPLVGGRLDYAHGRPVSVLVYRRRQHVIDVFAWPTADAHHITVSRGYSSKGYQVVHWAVRRIEYWAVSDLNEAELKTFARSFSDAS